MSDAEGWADQAATAMRAALAAVDRQDWLTASTRFTEAARAFDNAGRHDAAVRAHMGQANSLSETGRLDQASVLLAELRSGVDENHELWVSLSANLAVCRARGGDLDGAEDLWRVCFHRYLELGQPVDAVTCLLNASLSLHDRGRHDNALHLVGGARSILAQIAQAPATLIAECDSTAGLILCALGEFPSARAALEAAIHAFSSMDRQLDEGRACGNLAVICLQEGDVAAAHAWAPTAFSARLRSFARHPPGPPVVESGVGPSGP